MEEYWWTRLGYPTFEPDSSGYPRPGQVIKYYRVQKVKDNRTSWTQADLAGVLGITVKAVSEMENKDAGLDSIQRRRFLADLLGVPPLLLGLTSLEQITASLPVSSAPTIQIIQKNAIDIQEHKQFVQNAWDHYYRADFVTFFQNTFSRMNRLYKMYPMCKGRKLII